MKLKFGLSVPIAHYNADELKWYHRDAKRIMQMKEWNSRIYLSRSRSIVGITLKNGKQTYWVIDKINDKTTGEPRIKPLGQMEFNGIYLEPWQYVKYKLK